MPCYPPNVGVSEGCDWEGFLSTADRKMFQALKRHTVLPRKEPHRYDSSVGEAFQIARKIGRLLVLGGQSHAAANGCYLAVRLVRGFNRNLVKDNFVRGGRPRSNTDFESMCSRSGIFVQERLSEIKVSQALFAISK